MNRLALLLPVALVACAETSVQPMARDTFRVSTSAESVCGPSGARTIAFKAAAIEVIRKGGDKFIIMNDMTQSGVQGNFFTGYDTVHSQGMIVRMIPQRSSEASNALSARETLGADWQQIVAKGVPNTCT